MQDTLIQSTPNDCALPRRRADFATFNEAIDYAARSEKGLNFHDMRGTLERAYPYREMREDALAMAHRLQLSVTAEGVETREQEEFLRSEGCDRFQGYRFSRPLSPEAFEALLRGQDQHGA